MWNEKGRAPKMEAREIPTSMGHGERECLFISGSFSNTLEELVAPQAVIIATPQAGITALTVCILTRQPQTLSV